MTERENGGPEPKKQPEVEVFYTSGVSYKTVKQTVRPSWHHEEETYEVREEYGAWGVAIIDSKPLFYVAYNMGGVHDNWSVYRPVHPGKFTPPVNSGDVDVEHREKILKLFGVKVEKDPQKLIDQYAKFFASEENAASYTEFFKQYDRDSELRSEFIHKVKEALNYKHPNQK